MKSRIYRSLLPLVLLFAALLAACDANSAADLLSAEGEEQAGEESSISGTVWEDKDGDGDREDGEEGLGNVQVLLKDSDGSVYQEVRTSGEGYFLFDGIEYGSLWTIVVVPGSFGITKPGPDSQVSQADGSATVVGGDILNAGLVSATAALTPTAPPTATGIPAVPDRVTLTPLETGQPEISVGYYVDCVSGAEVEPPDWRVTSPPEVHVPDQPVESGSPEVGASQVSISVTTQITRSIDTTLYTGVDLSGLGQTQTGRNDQLAIFQGTTTGFSTDPEGNMAAGQALPSGQFLNLTTLANGSLAGDRYLIEIPVSELQGGLTTVRITLTDLDICWLSGSLGENYGFVDAAELNPDLADFLSGIRVQRICNTAVCFMLSEDINFESTGEGTGDITFENGSVGQLVTGIRPGGANDVRASYSGWVFEPAEESAQIFLTDQAVELNWLQANNARYGLQGAIENGNSSNLQSADFALVFTNPIPESDQSLLLGQFAGIVESARPNVIFNQ